MEMFRFFIVYCGLWYGELLQTARVNGTIKQEKTMDKQWQQQQQIDSHNRAREGESSEESIRHTMPEMNSVERSEVHKCVRACGNMNTK